MTSASVAAVGVFGANFTSISINLPSETALNEEALLASTQLAWSNEGVPQIYDFATGQFSALTTNFGAGDASPSWSATGEFIVTAELDSVSGARQLFVYSSDGSTRTQITTSAGDKDRPSFSTASTRIVFEHLGDLWAINRDGTSLARLTNTPETERFARFIGPTATRIGYARGNQFWDMTTTGTGQTFRFSVPGTGIDGIDFDPTGTEFVTVRNNTLLKILSRVRVVDGSIRDLVSVPVAEDIFGPTYAPTGSHVAFIRNTASGSTLETVRLRDRNVSVIALLNDAPLLHLSSEWGPLVRRRNVIAAASGVLHTNAAGFMYAMQGSLFSSFLAFDAVTRNTVDIDVEKSSFSSNTLFATITAADSINMLRYINGYSTPRTTVVDPANPATYLQGAIVGIDGTSGRVTAVVGFTRGRSGPKPLMTQENGQVTIQGDLAGVWNAEGKKVADQATSVILDAKTGEVLRKS